MAQVAVAITVLPLALHLGFHEVKMGAVRAAGMDADDYQRETAARFADRLPELVRRLQANPAVVGVSFEGRLPGRSSLIEIEGVAGPAESGAHRIPTRPRR